MISAYNYYIYFLNLNINIILQIYFISIFHLFNYIFMNSATVATTCNKKGLSLHSESDLVDTLWSLTAMHKAYPFAFRPLWGRGCQILALYELFCLWVQQWTWKPNQERYRMPWSFLEKILSRTLGLCVVDPSHKIPPFSITCKVDKLVWREI